MTRVALALLFGSCLFAQKSGFVRTSDGVKIHYLEAGSGPAIVMQPGWTMPAWIWERQLQGLSKKFRVVAIDPRSQGESDRPMQGHYPARRAADIKQVIDDLKLGPAVLVGWSLGVPEVLAYVKEFGTGSLKSVVLVDGMVFPDPRFTGGMNTMLAAMQRDRAAFTAAFVKGMYSTPQPEAYLKRLTDAALAVPTDSALALLANVSIMPQTWTEALGRIDKPLIYAVTPRLKEQVDQLRAKAPAARIEIFENAGHALFVDAPERFNRLLEDAAGAPASAALYEEDPVATMAIRNENWNQMEAFAAALPARPRPAGATLKERIGYPAPGFLPKPGAPRMEKAGEDAIATYYRVRIQVAPAMDVYGLYLVPKNARFPAPLVISKHGGGGFPEMALFKGGANYHDMIRGAAAEGYVVFAPLTVMYPFRDRDHGSPIPEKVRELLDEAFRPKGTSLAAVEVMKISRALDSLLAARREIDPKRIAMVGLSYGGYYTMYTTGLEPRIKAAVASCSYRDQDPILDKPGGRLMDITSAENVGLIAPRPLQVQAGVADKGFPIDNVRSGVAKARPHYAKSPEKLDYAEFEGGHEWRGALAWAFLKKWL